jgi:hypothetical protein
MTNEELKAIRDRAEAATPGPWYWEKLDADGWNDTEMPCLVSASVEGVMDFGDCEQYYPTEGSPPNDKDAEFIAHAREDVPKLLAEIERLKEAEKFLEGITKLFNRVTNEYIKSDAYEGEVVNLAWFINDCILDGNPILSEGDCNDSKKA